MWQSKLGLLASVVIVAAMAGPTVGNGTAITHPWSPPAIEASTLFTSTNWAGYVAANSGATNHSVSTVAGTWVQPAVNCTGVTGTEIAAFWVGMDGAFAPSLTVEQTGTIAQCTGSTASYYAWWELYPLNSVQKISTLTVKAGDTINASVTWTSGNSFTMKIVDGTHSFSKSGVQVAIRNSAECITERPSNGVTLYPLAMFGKVRFSSCTATIGGSAGPIGSFTTVGQINMARVASSVVIANTGPLSTSKRSFTVTWKHSS